MKAITLPPAKVQRVRPPSFSDRPKRLSSELNLVVEGYGKLKFRPIRPDDEQEMIRFHHTVSDDSIYRRYFEYLGFDQRTAHQRLIQICANVPDSFAIVAEHSSPHHPAAILAVGRLTTTSEPFVATFDTLISSGENTRHLARALLIRLVKLAHAFGFKILTGELLVDDHDALNLCRALGFSLQTFPQDGLMRAMLDL
jgi:acetyltransferase